MCAANMSINSSSTSDYLQLNDCVYAEVTVYMSTAFAALKVILLLPLSTFILYLGYHQWRQQHSSVPATHSDIFTYHMAAVELIWVLGSFFYFGGSYTSYSPMFTAGLYTFVASVSGETLFHLLTCVERYLAVVHPITYRGLRNARGVRIRNICIGSVWLLSFGPMAVTAVMCPNSIVIQMLCGMIFSIIVLSFCSLSVLCVLIRPGPGDRGGKKERVDQSKQRAFYTITAISAAVWLWFVGYLIGMAMSMSPLLVNSVGCLVGATLNWLNLCSSVVSPLLYLHRAGKPLCCRLNKE